ncbi:MAG TPA: TA system VapC family ribonuclease toxin [Candidatus Limnocylindria bacterium]|nr:TA system VapC family ribonuclease toxin [Candidatus Limnocylindria bacterium]
MSATIDVNILLYASDESSSFHAKAAELLDRLARGPDLLYLFWPVLMGYLRMSTHPALFPRPLSVDIATVNVGQLLGLPHARAVGEGDDFWQAYGAVTAGVVVRGNLVSDAHLVALMRENGVGTLWSHDRDFRKFEAVRVRDPFA